MANYEETFLNSLGRASSAVTGLLQQINEPGWKEKMDYQTEKSAELYRLNKEADTDYFGDTSSVRKSEMTHGAQLSSDAYSYRKGVDFSYMEKIYGIDVEKAMKMSDIDIANFAAKSAISENKDVRMAGVHLATAKALSTWNITGNIKATMIRDEKLHGMMLERDLLGSHLKRGEMGLQAAINNQFVDRGYELKQQDRIFIHELDRLSKSEDYALKEEHLHKLHDMEKRMAIWARNQGIEYQRGTFWGNALNGWFGTTQGSDDYNLQMKKIIDKSNNDNYESQLEIGRMDWEQRQFFSHELMNSPAFQTMVPDDEKGGMLAMSAAFSGLSTEGMDLSDPGTQAALLTALNMNANSQAAQVKYDQINVDFEKQLAFGGEDMPGYSTHGLIGRKEKARGDIETGVQSLVGATTLFTYQADKAIKAKSMGQDTEVVTEAISDAQQALSIIDRYLEHAQWADGEELIPTLNNYRTVYQNILDTLEG